MRSQDQRIFIFRKALHKHDNENFGCIILLNLNVNPLKKI